jgi:hypothetical protein
MQFDQESRGTLFPDERHAGETALRSVQLIELRIMKIVDHLCGKHGIDPWPTTTSCPAQRGNPQ